MIGGNQAVSGNIGSSGGAVGGANEAGGFGGGAVPSATDDIMKLQEKIMKQQTKSNDLDKEIKRVQDEILNQRKLMNGKTPQEKHQKLLKEIKNLEFRLDKSNQRYNSTIASNNKLRSEIDQLRRERKIF